MKLPPVFWLVAATTLIRLAFAATTGLGVDESYMVTAGRVLSLGYFDHPPASWWLSWGAARLFGTEAPWAVRLPFILLFALSQVLIWRITCLVADRRAAIWAVVALNLSPVFGVTTGTWVLPDGPLDTALLGAVLCLLHALPATGRRAFGWWMGTGLCAGLALFSKYSAVLTIGGAFLSLLAIKPHRHWLARAEPYLAVILALAVFSPVLIWNATHGWASFAFQGDRAAGLRFRPLMPIQTLAGEALFVLPWVWVPMMILFVDGFRQKVAWRGPSQHAFPRGVTSRNFHHGMIQSDKIAPRQVLVWLAAPPILVFALISAWSSQRVLYHWAAPGYLMLFPLLGDAIARYIDRPWVRGLLASSTILTLAAVTAIATQIQFDWLGSSLTAILHTDPTSEGLDWTSIRDDLRARGLLPPGALVATANWRDAGKIGYALGPDAIMLCLNADARQFAIAHPLHAFAGKDVLLLLPDPATDPTHWFRSIPMLPGTSVRLDGRLLRTITVVRGQGLLQHP